MAALQERTRTLVTLGVLSALVLLGALWGWSAATKPFPGAVEAPTCVETTVSAGSRLFPDQVTVSVLNASRREGLAGRTLRLFTDAGFHTGDTGNAPDDTEVEYAEVWSSQVPDPAARLVASRLGPRAQVVERTSDEPGIVVVVGDTFEELAEGRPATKVGRDLTICTPPE